MMWLKSIKALSWVASVGLVSCALFIAYIVLFPVDVLKNWELNLPCGDNAQPKCNRREKLYLGEIVILESTYTKTMDTSSDSKSSRYIECKNERGIYLRYALNEAKADRKAGVGKGTGVEVGIPSELKGVNLPTHCFFSICIDYDVYPRRAKPECNQTKEFQLNTKLSANTTPNTEVTVTTNTQTDVSLSNLPEGSDIEAMPSATTTQSTPAQPDTTPEPEPSLLEDLLKVIIDPFRR